MYIYNWSYLGELKKFAIKENFKFYEAPPVSLRNWLVNDFDIVSFSMNSIFDQLPLSNEGNFFDIGIVASFGYYLPNKILKEFKLGTFNIHPSLLPKFVFILYSKRINSLLRYRGASPMQAALLNMEKETCVSIIEIDKKMDRGNILTQSKIVILF